MSTAEQLTITELPRNENAIPLVAQAAYILFHSIDPDNDASLFGEHLQEVWNGRLFVAMAHAEHADLMIGVASLNSDGGFLESLVVDPDYRRRGIGGQLVRLAEEAVEKNGFSEVQVYPAQGAEPFFASLGYSYSESDTNSWGYWSKALK